MLLLIFKNINFIYFIKNIMVLIVMKKDRIDGGEVL